MRPNDETRSALPLNYGREASVFAGRAGIAVLACFLLAAALVTGIMVWWWTELDRLTLSVHNGSGAKIQSVRLVVPEAGPPGPLIDLGTLAPGETKSHRMHFGRDRGPAALHVVADGGREQTLLCGFLLSDDGPYRWRVTITPDTLQIRGTGSYITGRVFGGPPRPDAWE
jgi:hypothetical protein